MKKKIFLFMPFLLILTCAPAPRIFTFINETVALPITVSPDPETTQDWTPFTLAAGTEYELTLSEPYPFFIFDNTNLIYMERAENDEIHFLDNPEHL